MTNLASSWTPQEASPAQAPRRRILNVVRPTYRCCSRRNSSSSSICRRRSRYYNPPTPIARDDEVIE
jgi:hypothetical protein